MDWFKKKPKPPPPPDPIALEEEARKQRVLAAQAKAGPAMTPQELVEAVMKDIAPKSHSLLFRAALEKIAPQYKEALSSEPHWSTSSEQWFRRAPFIRDGLISTFKPLADALPQHAEHSPLNYTLLSTLNQESYRQQLSSIRFLTGSGPFELHGVMEAPWITVDLTDPKSVLYPILNISLPLPLDDNRFSHTHIIGGTGAGKTTLLENLILHDLKGEASLVVVDSQGDLIRKISHLKTDREIILISPKDVAFPVALNVFDVNRERLGKYDQATKEQVIAGVIQTFDYLFTGLLGADLTAKQNVFFKYVARLMLSLPETLGRNATILDMLRLMEDVGPYKQAIQSLPPIQREFFDRDFTSKTFAQTKEQIRYRLHAIIENPTLARLFTSPNTKLDLFTELNRGSVILVDTAKDFLKGSSGHFGQIFISLVLQAVLERAALPESQRKPTFLFVDEAAEYFDANIDDFLNETRKQKLGCVFAHQYLDQCSSALRASLAANTSIKFVGGVSNQDARAMAAELRTTPEFILNQPRLHFAAHIRNQTPHAVSVPVLIGTLEKEPQLTPEEYEAFIARNRERVAYTETPKPMSTPPDEDVSETW